MWNQWSDTRLTITLVYSKKVFVIDKVSKEYYSLRFLLIILSAMFLLIAIVIKLTSKGSIFSKQQGVRYRVRFFACPEFRTMVKNAKELKQTFFAFE